MLHGVFWLVPNSRAVALRFAQSFGIVRFSQPLAARERWTITGGAAMSVVEKLSVLADRIPKLNLAQIETEEATKNALIMPFIQALGYDVFNPEEVVPEFTADVGLKKGEKVDYAIRVDGKVVIIIEAKKVSEDLSSDHMGQLYRYFGVMHTRIAILTNGLVYQFYSDLDDKNKMDHAPFLVLDLRDLREKDLNELTKLSRENFDLDNMLVAASDLKAMRQIRVILDRQFEDPDEDFVKYFFQAANPNSRFAKSAKEQFTRLVKESLRQRVTEQANKRLQSALTVSQADPATPVPEDGSSASANGANEAVAMPTSEGEADNSNIVTTEEELDGFRIIKAIVCSEVSPERIVHRDTQSYFGILFDDNNRRPICRLRFNSDTKKYIGIFDADKKETKHPLSSLNEIYKHAEPLRATVRRYLDSEGSVDDATPVP